MPGDAVEISSAGVKSAFIRRNINAVSNAGEFGGGIKAAGTNYRDSHNLIDGDPDTYWQPHSRDPLDEWWIEVDLGRVVSASAIRLEFEDKEHALEFFSIQTSDGEPFFRTNNTIIPGTVSYNDQFNYSFNDKSFVVIELNLKPIQYIRIQANRTAEQVRLGELTVRSIGDNIALGIFERGGAININTSSDDGKRQLAENDGAANSIMDGDIRTYWSTRQGSDSSLRFGEFEVDLGAVYWVDRIRILGDKSGISPGGIRSRFLNFMWYKLYASDGSTTPDGSPLWRLIGALSPTLFICDQQKSG